MAKSKDRDFSDVIDDEKRAQYRALPHGAIVGGHTFRDIKLDGVTVRACRGCLFRLDEFGAWNGRGMFRCESADGMSEAQAANLATLLEVA